MLVKPSDLSAAQGAALSRHGIFCVNPAHPRAWIFNGITGSLPEVIALCAKESGSSVPSRVNAAKALLNGMLLEQSVFQSRAIAIATHLLPVGPYLDWYKQHLTPGSGVTGHCRAISVEPGRGQYFNLLRGIANVATKTEAAPEAQPEFETGMLYRVRDGDHHPFADGRTFVVTRSTPNMVHYKYTHREHTANRDREQLEKALKAGDLVRIGEAVRDEVPEDLFKTAAPTTSSVSGLHETPLTVKVGDRFQSHSHPYGGGALEVRAVETGRGLDGTLVEYKYLHHSADFSTCTKPMEHFLKHLQEGKLTPIAPPPQVNAQKADAQRPALIGDEEAAVPPFMPTYQLKFVGHAIEFRPDVSNSALSKKIEESLVPFYGQRLDMKARERIRATVAKTVRQHAESVAVDQKASPCTNIDYAAVENRVTVSIADGTHLDNLAALYGITRIEGESDTQFRSRIGLSAPIWAPSKRGMALGEIANLYASTSNYLGIEEIIEPSAHKKMMKSFRIRGNNPTLILEDNVESQFNQPKEENPMSRIVNVFLFDNTAGLKADQRLIGKVEDIATDGDNQQVLMEVAVNHNIGEMLKAHNLKRKTIINLDILGRVGKTVYMQPIELADVTYKVVDVVDSSAGPQKPSARLF